MQTTLVESRYQIARYIKVRLGVLRGQQTTWHRAEIVLEVQWGAGGLRGREGGGDSRQVMSWQHYWDVLRTLPYTIIITRIGGIKSITMSCCKIHRHSTETFVTQN